MRKKLLITVCAVAVLGAATWLTLALNRPKVTKVNYGETAVSDTNIPASTNTQQSTSNGGSSMTKDSTSVNSTTTLSSSMPSKPSGSFVSNHHPSLSGTTAPSAMNSVCITGINTDCTVTFTNSGGVTKSLTTKNTGTTGAVSWDWQVADIGLTPGSWTIKAVATTRAGVAESVDNMQLVVGE